MRNMLSSVGSGSRPPHAVCNMSGVQTVKRRATYLPVVMAPLTSLVFSFFFHLCLWLSHSFHSCFISQCCTFGMLLNSVQSCSQAAVFCRSETVSVWLFSVKDRCLQTSSHIRFFSFVKNNFPGMMHGNTYGYRRRKPY